MPVDSITVTNDCLSWVLVASKSDPASCTIFLTVFSASWPDWIWLDVLLLAVIALIAAVCASFIADSDAAKPDRCPPVVAMLMLRMMSASSRPSRVVRSSPRSPCAAAIRAEVLLLLSPMVTVAARVFGGAPPPPPPLPPTATEVADGENVAAAPPSAPPVLVLVKAPVTVL